MQFAIVKLTYGRGELSRKVMSAHGDKKKEKKNLCTQVKNSRWKKTCLEKKGKKEKKQQKVGNLWQVRHFGG